MRTECKHELNPRDCAVCKGKPTKPLRARGSAPQARALHLGHCALECGEPIHVGDRIVLTAPDEVTKWSHAECVEQHGMPEREKTYQ